MNSTRPEGQDPSDQRLLTEERTRDIYDRVRAMARGEGPVAIRIRAWWQGELRWARNRVALASDRRDLDLWIGCQTKKGLGQVWTNQTDDASLEAAIRAAESESQLFGTGFVGTADTEHDGLRMQRPLLPFPDTAIWSDATYAVTPEQRGQIAQALSVDAERHGMLSAGYLQMRVAEHRDYGWLEIDEFPGGDAQLSDSDTLRIGEDAERMSRTAGYIRYTEAQCSMTVRHPRGTGSGWAGLSGYDWSVIDGDALAKRALDKCLQSIDPVAIEPGRYTVILEPQAVAALAKSLVGALNNRDSAEKNAGPFALGVDEALGIGRSKLGLKVIDDRISIRHDPMHPQLGILPRLGLRPITWIENGVLQTLSYERGKNRETYSIPLLNENIPALQRMSYEMTGGTTTTDEMIATTKRGVLVTRLAGLRPIRGNSLLYTGVTRDGLWLIENGKISKSIKNMRWTDSPLFVLNQVEQLGPSVPVFQPGTDDLMPAIVPTVKANDFAFTATIDAI